MFCIDFEEIVGESQLKLNGGERERESHGRIVTPGFDDFSKLSNERIRAQIIKTLAETHIHDIKSAFILLLCTYHLIYECSNVHQIECHYFGILFHLNVSILHFAATPTKKWVFVHDKIHHFVKSKSTKRCAPIQTNIIRMDLWYGERWGKRLPEKGRFFFCLPMEQMNRWWVTLNLEQFWNGKQHE